MLAGHPEICLVEPEIPQNTGNIGRLAAASGSRLHLVPPFGFDASDKQLLRPGLDYWPYLDLEMHSDFPSLAQRFDREEIAFFSARATRTYEKIPRHTRLLVFGSETKGLPPTIRKSWHDHLYRIPIFHPEVRSLNLANAVAIVVYYQLARKKDT